MKFIHPRRWLRRIFNSKLTKGSTCEQCSGNYNLYTHMLLLGKGTILFNNTELGFPPYYGTIIIEARHEDALISIGECEINNNFHCCANHGSIRIGNNCRIGCNVEIINSNFHGLTISKRDDGGTSKEIVIGDNVFIGNYVHILPGVTIGDGAVIANSSVVFDDVKAHTIVRGNPATFYMEIYE